MRGPLLAAAPPTARPDAAPRPASLRFVRRIAAVAAAALLCVGCPWHRYDEVLRVHLDVLGSLADKAAGNAAAGTRPRSNDVTELTYPLQRARQFAHQYRGYGDRASYAAFVIALDRYQAFVETIDSARGDEERWRAEQPRVAAAFTAWQQAAQAVRDALARGD